MITDGNMNSTVENLTDTGSMSLHNTFLSLKRTPFNEVLLEYIEWLKLNSPPGLFDGPNPDWEAAREKFFLKYSWTGDEFLFEHSRRTESIFFHIEG